MIGGHNNDLRKRLRNIIHLFVLDLFFIRHSNMFTCLNDY